MINPFIDDWRAVKDWFKSLEIEDEPTPEPEKISMNEIRSTGHMILGTFYGLIFYVLFLHFGHVWLGIICCYLIIFTHLWANDAWIVGEEDKNGQKE